MNIAVTKPRIVAFEVTRKCRFNCVNCRAVASEKVDSEYLTTAVFINNRIFLLGVKMFYHF